MRPFFPGADPNAPPPPDLAEPGFLEGSRRLPGSSRGRRSTSRGPYVYRDENELTRSLLSAAGVGDVAGEREAEVRAALIDVLAPLPRRPTGATARERVALSRRDCIGKAPDGAFALRLDHLAWPPDRRVPALPTDELVEPRRSATNLDTSAASRGRAGCPIVTRQTKWTSSGTPRSCLHLGDLLRQDAVDAAREALVDRGKLKQQECGAGVDVPVGRGPADLLAFAELVRLVGSARGSSPRGCPRRRGPARSRSRPGRPPATYSSSPARRASSARVSGAVTTTSRCPWLKPPLGARRTVETMRWTASRGMGSGR